MLLYNVTMYTGVNLLPDAVEKLSEHPNIVGLKDSGNDMLQIGDYLSRSKPGFTVLAGAAPTLFTPRRSACMAPCWRSPASCPSCASSSFSTCSAGRIDDARALQRRLMPVARSIGPVYGVPGLKAALDLLGLHGGVPRAPLNAAPPAVVEVLRGQLAALGVLQRHMLPATERILLPRAVAQPSVSRRSC